MWRKILEKTDLRQAVGILFLTLMPTSDKDYNVDILIIVE
jgi:hypothetical protein